MAWKCILKTSKLATELTQTVISLFHKFRKHTEHFLDVYSKIIRSPDIIVQIYKCILESESITKNINQIESGILRGIEQTDEKKLFLIEVLDRK